MKNFEAKNDLPFGIRKGDTITEVSPNVYHNSNGVVIPMDVKKESTFFSEIKTLVTKFKTNDIIVLTKQESCRLHAKYNQSFTIPAWTPLTIVGYVEKFKKSYAIVDFNGRKYEVNEKILELYEEYYFINSSGKINKTTLKRDNDADLFRTKTYNIFRSYDDASSNLKSLMLGGIEKLLEIVELSKKIENSKS